MDRQSYMKRVSRGLSLAALVVTLALMALVSAPNAAAAGDPVGDIGTQYRTPLILIAVVGVGAALVVPTLGQKTRTYLLVGGIVAGGVVAVGYMAGGGPGGVDCAKDPTNPLCKTIEGATWNVRLSTTYDGDLDIDTEVLDSQGYTACDGGTPDLNGEIGAIATQIILDEGAGRVQAQSDSDDDVTRSALGFQEVDCLIFTFDIALTSIVDTNGDGTADLVPWGARVVSIGPPTFNDGNQTTMPTIFYDSDSGWEAAWLTEGNIWVPALDNQYSLPYPGTSGGWVTLGSHAGVGGAFDQGSIAVVLDTTTGSPTGYTVPAAAGNTEFSIVIQVGSASNYRTLTYDWILFTRA